jgi:hypothetical protein
MIKNKNTLIELIDKALHEIEDFGINSKAYKIREKPLSDFIYVLGLLKSDINSSSGEIRERVLSATLDIAGLIAKQFEDTPFDGFIYEIIDHLLTEIPHFKQLKPLGMDFGLEDPI